MDGDSELAIETSGLTKVFGKTHAVDGVNLRVNKGSIFGFLGPNGAGKTTTIRMLATLIRPDGGAAHVFGHDVVREPEAVRRRLSLTGQFASVDSDLTGKENLILLGRLLGMSSTQARSRADDLLDAFGLLEARDRQAKKYSGGMRRRLDIAASLVTTPDLLFLDEPTTGLDPHNRNLIWEMIRAVVSNGTTVLLTTQYLEEVDRLADSIAVIDQGRIIAEGTSAELKASVGAGVLHVRLSDASQQADAERALTRVLGVPVEKESDQGKLSARIAADASGQDRGARAVQSLAELSRLGIGLTEFTLGQPSLDEVFLALTGHKADHVDSVTDDKEHVA